jgi:hypothetical protein
MKQDKEHCLRRFRSCIGRFIESFLGYLKIQLCQPKDGFLTKKRHKNEFIRKKCKANIRLFFAYVNVRNTILTFLEWGKNLEYSVESLVRGAEWHMQASCITNACLFSLFSHLVLSRADDKSCDNALNRTVTLTILHGLTELEARKSSS